MDKLTMIETVMAAKAKKGVTWEAIAGEIGMAPVWVASVCLGMNSADAEQASAIAKYLDLGPDAAKALQMCHEKVWDQTVPTDPLIYRFYEIMGVYGMSMKEVIHEKFGDGIMSAIDFTVDIDKVEDPKGDRVQVTMCGKFLPYTAW